MEHFERCRQKAQYSLEFESEPSASTVYVHECMEVSEGIRLGHSMRLPLYSHITEWVASGVVFQGKCTVVAELRGQGTKASKLGPRD